MTNLKLKPIAAAVTRSLNTRLPAPFLHEFERMFESYRLRSANRKKTVSQRTAKARRETLLRAYRTLRYLGYNLPSPKSLSRKHVKALVDYWCASGLSAAYIHTSLCILRTFSPVIGKEGMIPGTFLLVDDPARLKRSSVLHASKTWEAHGVDRKIIDDIFAFDMQVGIQLMLMDAFGLRRKEAVCFLPSKDWDMAMKRIEVYSGTKNGRPRLIDVRTDYQVAVLKAALELERAGRLRKPGKSLEQALQRFNYVVGHRFGINKKNMGVTSHGLRHSFAEVPYVLTAGTNTPVGGGDVKEVDRQTHVQASFASAKALGHSRIDVTRAYYGSHGHEMRAAPATPQDLQFVPATVTIRGREYRLTPLADAAGNPVEDSGKR